MKTSFLLDEANRAAIDPTRLRRNVEHAEHALAERTTVLSSVLDRSGSWRHDASVHDDATGTMRPVSLRMRRTLGDNALVVTLDGAVGTEIRLRLHEDDPDRSTAVNGGCAESLDAVRRHVAVARAALDHHDAVGDWRRPDRDLLELAAAFALVEAVDPIHRGLPVWYRAPWHSGRALLSQEPSRMTLPGRPRRWPHGRVTLISRFPTPGESSVTYAFGALVAKSPTDLPAVDQMRLLRMAEDHR